LSEVTPYGWLWPYTHGYPEVQTSASNAFAVAVELAAQIELSRALAEQLALAIWTMAHGFATLSLEGALGRVGALEAVASAEALARRLIYPAASNNPLL
jgi:hypothetical protein